VYHVDLQFSVDQRVYWCRSTPSKLPDEWTTWGNSTGIYNIN